MRPTPPLESVGVLCLNSYSSLFNSFSLFRMFLVPIMDSATRSKLSHEISARSFPKWRSKLLILWWIMLKLLSGLLFLLILHSDDEICKNLSSQGVTSVRRISIWQNNYLIPTNTFILPFGRPAPPQSVKAGYLNITVDLYVPNPLRCFKCQQFGDGQSLCRNKLTCAHCGQFDHVSKECKESITCINCKRAHFAYSRECPKWKLEKWVQ